MRKILNLKSKKAQEEIVGFGMIVILVSVIAIILIGLYFTSKKNSSGNLDSLEVNQFLDSAMEYTSSCAISFAPAYSNLAQLTGDCYNKRKCVSGEDSCVVLKKTLNEAIEKSWSISPQSYYKGYDLKSVIRLGNKTEEIYTLSEGNCSVSYIGSEYLSSAYPGSIITTLKICV